MKAKIKSYNKNMLELKKDTDKCFFIKDEDGFTLEYLEYCCAHLHDENWEIIE